MVKVFFDVLGDIFAGVCYLFIKGFVDCFVDEGLECFRTLRGFSIESGYNFGSSGFCTLLVVPGKGCVGSSFFVAFCGNFVADLVRECGDEFS